MFQRTKCLAEEKKQRVRSSQMNGEGLVKEQRDLCDLNVKGSCLCWQATQPSSLLPHIHCHALNVNPSAVSHPVQL